MKLIKKEYREKSGQELAQICAEAALDTKAEDLVILDVRGLTTFTDYFVIMNGKSTRHVQALAEAIEGAVAFQTGQGVKGGRTRRKGCGFS